MTIIPKVAASTAVGISCFVFIRSLHYCLPDSYQVGFRNPGRGVMRHTLERGNLLWGCLHRSGVANAHDLSRRAGWRHGASLPRAATSYGAPSQSEMPVWSSRSPGRKFAALGSAIPPGAAVSRLLLASDEPSGQGAGPERLATAEGRAVPRACTESLKYQNFQKENWLPGPDSNQRPTG